MSSCTNTHLVMRLLFLLCLGRALGVVRSEFENDDIVVGGDNYHRVNPNTPPISEDDAKMIHKIEEEMLTLNKSSNRDKRALGILLQGFMEALGYNLQPVQIASLPNPTAAGQMPMPMPMPMPGAPPPMQMPAAAQMSRQAAAPPAPAPMPPTNNSMAPAPRQRETLRFTGVLNFGNNANTTNLINHLAQYEQLFHGNATTPAPAVAAPNIDPRARPPLPEPLFVKIPLPIAPNLPPPQPPSPMPIENSYRNEYHDKSQEESYKNTDDEEGRHGDDEEENNNSHIREEYESSHEEYSEPRHGGDRHGEDRHGDDRHNEDRHNEDRHGNDRHDDDRDGDDRHDEVRHGEDRHGEDRHGEDSHGEDRQGEEYEEDEGSYEEKPKEPQNIEKHYKKNQNVVNYSVENKPLNDPSQVSEEVPIVNSKFDHTMYLNGKKQDDEAYKLEAEIQSKAEALAEENAEREIQKNRENESREKEISNSNEGHQAKYIQNDYAEDEEDPGSAERENYSDSRNQDEGSAEHEQESKISEKPANDAPRKHVSVEEKPKTTEASIRRHEHHPSDEPVYHNDGKRTNYYYPTLPIGYDRERLQPDYTLRDSYGQSLEKPGGKVDERVAGYFTMFKNPQTGVYDPNRIQQYESSRKPYDYEDLINGYRKIEKEYGLPENKYEEYEISDNDDRAEHRANNDSRDYEEERNENESRKKSKKVSLHPPDCDCSTDKSDFKIEEARNHPKTVTTETTLTTYVPYLSTVNYRYEPLNYNQGIIQSLTSYDPPTTISFDSPTTSSRPTQAVPIERFTTSSLIHEAETKEIKTWPAPFDYVYDNSEHRKIVVKGRPKSSTQNPKFSPTATTPCYHEAHSLPPGEHADRVHNLLREHEKERFGSSSNRNHRRPKNSRRGRKAKGTQPSTSVYSTLPTTPPTYFDQYTRPSRNDLTSTESSSTERFRIRIDDDRPATYQPISSKEIYKAQTKKLRTTKRPKNSPSGFTSAYAPNNSNESRQKSRAKPTTKQKYDDYPQLRGGISKEITSNYVEKNGMLIIPEPTPYYFNEKIEEFKDEPLSDTEKVRVKEYRNRITSVKTSKLKQLHPERPLEIFKYTKHH